jgi:hypothetical protein
MKSLTRIVVAGVVLCMVGSMSNAEEQAEGPEVSVNADLELFFESSNDVGGSGDDDKFKSNQLYLDFRAKFENNLSARLKLDGADLESSDGTTVSAKVVEEANFTAKDIGGFPVTLIFGKDQMPFGLDYDKYLNDSIAHQFEIDKVWGLHGVITIPCVGKFAAASYQHRHSDDEEVLATNETGDNYTAQLTIDKLIKNLTVNFSAATESYSDTESTDDDTGGATVSAKDDESRYGAGLVYKVKGLGNVNAEYIEFSSLKGRSDYDPSLITLGVQWDVIDKTAVWGRFEIIEEDTDDDVETEFWTVGVKYSPTKSYTLMVEFSNFNSGDMSDAKDLMVAKNSIENSVLFGVRAKF